jgi:hypothetical protein
VTRKQTARERRHQQQKQPYDHDGESSPPIASSSSSSLAGVGTSPGEQPNAETPGEWLTTDAESTRAGSPELAVWPYFKEPEHSPVLPPTISLKEFALGFFMNVYVVRDISSISSTCCL